jgi:hypothetical protein
MMAEPLLRFFSVINILFQRAIEARKKIRTGCEKAYIRLVI